MCYDGYWNSTKKEHPMTTLLGSVDGNITVLDETRTLLSCLTDPHIRRADFEKKLLRVYMRHSSGPLKLRKWDLIHTAMDMARFHTGDLVKKMSKRDKFESVFLMGVAIERMFEAKDKEEFEEIFAAHWKFYWDQNPI